MYEIFYVSTGLVDEILWKNFKDRFPNALKLENVKTFEDVRSKAFTKFFWVIWDHVIVKDDFNLDYRIPKWDEQYIHVFKNGDFFDGICIFPKNVRILQKEWEYRFFTNKKEIDIQASIPIPWDVVFISYYESFAEKNFDDLCSKIIDNKINRVKNVKGIHQAHINAAQLVSSDMFYVVDADAIVVDSFKFNHQIPYYDFNAKKTVHVWKSKNPVNGLVYGNGGIKLLPRQLTINMNIDKPDMTTSISKWFKAMPDISNITAFNTDPFNTWKSAYRECAKLSSRVIDRQQDAETDSRLNIWCNQSTDKYALDGANLGKEFGITNKTNLEELKKINDFEWLKEQFNGRYSKN